MSSHNTLASHELPPIGAEALPPVRAAVLVGGAGRRMGRPKHDIELAGRSMLNWVVCALVDSGLPVVLVGEVPESACDPAAQDGLSHALSAQDCACPDLPRIGDLSGLRGPPAGIAAVQNLDDQSAWLVIACDMPFVSIAAVRWVLAQRTIRRIAVMPRVCDEFVEPLLACYEPQSAQSVAEIGARRGARLQELATRDDVLTPVAPMELRCAWQNINTPHDLEVARVTLAGRARK